MSSIIRLATESDAVQILEIYAPFCNDSSSVVSFEVEPPSQDEMMSRINSVLQQLPWLVCEQNGQVLGYAYAGLHRQRAAYQWSVEVSVYIRDTERRSGIGQALYTSLFQILTLQGYFNAYAGMTLPNPGSARLHEKMGFKPIGTYHRVGYKNGAWRDVAWYELSLQPLVSNPEQPQNINLIRNYTGFKSALESGISLLR